ncbi:MAG: fructose-bisphosphate aldolase class II [Deltaproteobacteria bacterium]|nr:fructose-bisphosphate aldolase class II [Deltaproteobacteria bacterium]
MALIPLRTLLDHAAEHQYGVGAFNVNNMEQIQAIMEAARETESPVIVQASRGARSYSQDHYLRHLMLAATELYPEIPVVMHQDHGNSPLTCFSAIRQGFTSVMMDGSLKEDAKTPADFEYNCKVTRHVVDVAHAFGVSVEGELGCLGSLETGRGEKEDGHGFEGSLSRDQLLTDPEEAAEFVRQTGVDALAVAIGTSHGAYKFTRKPDGDILAISRIQAIHDRLPNTHLVMHGSSSVPQELQDLINRYGGQIRQTYGVPVEEIQKGIQHGVRKINVDTDNRLAITGAIRKIMAEKPEEFDPRTWLKPARDAMKQVVRDRMISFGQAGRAPHIRQVTLEEMSRKYFL